MGRWVTFEDVKASFSLFCCVYGIGTLGMPTNFSRAGPALAVVAIAFMAFANIYASIACCRALMKAPRSVKTLGDLGEWSMGKTGRYLVVVAQMGVCLLGSCNFLVLGGSLLDGLFPGAFSKTVWIILMSLSCLPVCLTPTLKEGAFAAFAGALGTIVSDVIGVAVLLNGMEGHGPIPKPDINFKQVATVFGNLSMAYAAGVLIPTLFREHSKPERMQGIVCVTLGFISCLFLILASTTYSGIGCQLTDNLLFAIYPDAETGLSTLGFHSDWGATVIAYLGMMLHIMIAFAIYVHPAFYILERMFLKMHQKPSDETEQELYVMAESPSVDVPEKISQVSNRNSISSMADIEKTNNDYEVDLSEYSGVNRVKYVIMRLALVTVLAVVSILLQDHFTDMTNFTGASSITVSCIILPIIFYLKQCWSSVPWYERIAAILVVTICLVFGCYVTITAGKDLFNPDEKSEDDPVFPFCHAENQFDIYYNATASD